MLKVIKTRQVNVKVAKTKLLHSILSEKISDLTVNYQMRFKDKYKIQGSIGKLSLPLSLTYPKPQKIKALIPGM